MILGTDLGTISVDAWPGFSVPLVPKVLLVYHPRQVAWHSPVIWSFFRKSAPFSNFSANQLAKCSRFFFRSSVNKLSLWILYGKAWMSWRKILWIVHRWWLVSAQKGVELTFWGFKPQLVRTISTESSLRPDFFRPLRPVWRSQVVPSLVNFATVALMVQKFGALHTRTPKWPQ